MHAVGARALHAVPATLRARARAQHLVRSQKPSPQPRCLRRTFTNSPRHHRALPDNVDEPNKDNNRSPAATVQPQQGVLGGVSAPEENSGGKSTGDQPVSSATDNLKEAFAGISGRGRNGRRRSDDGMPPVNLPAWFLDDFVSLHDREPSKLGESEFSDLLDLMTIAPDRRHSLHDYYTGQLEGMAWTEETLLNAATKLREGAAGPIDRWLATAPWYAAHALAVLACHPGASPESVAELEKLLREHIGDLPRILAPNRQKNADGVGDASKLSGEQSSSFSGGSIPGSQGEVLMRRELVATLRAEMRAVPYKSRFSKDGKRPISVLTIPNYQGRKLARAVVDDVATILGVDVVHLTAPNLAELVGGYLGQTPYTGRGDVTMLGYTTAAISGRMTLRYQARKDEDIELPEIFSQGSARMIKLPGLGRLANKLYQSAESDDRWDDLKMQHVLDELTCASDIKRSESSTARTTRRLIIHVSDFVELNMTGDGVMLLNKLRSITDRMWHKGREIVLVGSTSANLATTPELREKIEELSKDEHHFIPFHHTLTDVTRKEWESQDTAGENMNNIRAMLSAMTGKSVQLPPLPDVKNHDQIWEEFRDYLSATVYDISWVYRFATKILAFATTSSGAFPEGALLEALYLLKSQDKFWSQLHGAEEPYFSPLSSSPSWTGIANQAESGSKKTQKPAPYKGELNEFEKKFLPGIVNQSEIKTTFQDIICPQDTKETLIALTSLSLTRPEAFLYGVLATERIPGCLLYGPPGTGKTLMARAIARHSGASMLEVSAASINDKWVGNSEKNVRALFSLARKMSTSGTPVVLFLDEADALLGSRSSSRSRTGGHRETLNQFLREWDGLSNANRAFVIVATNRPFDLDDAVLRRLPQRVLFDLPLRDGRLAILRTILSDETLDPTVSLEDLAAQTELYSGSDLKNICVAAAMEAVKEEVRAQERHTGPETYAFPERRVLGRRHFDKALRDIGASISEDMPSLQAIRKFDERYGSARTKTRRRMGFEVVGDGAPRSDEALVRRPVAP